MYLAEFIKSRLAPRYAEFIGNEIQKAYLESYGDYGQNLFDRYVAYADAWVEDQDFKDSDTGELFDRKMLDQELSKIEEAGRHRQSQGLPQRGGQVRPALHGPTMAASRAVVDLLREDPRSHRKTHVHPGRGPSAGDQLLDQGRQGHPRKKHNAASSSAWSTADTPIARPGGWWSGTCRGGQGRLIAWAA